MWLMGAFYFYLFMIIPFTILFSRGLIKGSTFNEENLADKSTVLYLGLLKAIFWPFVGLYLVFKDGFISMLDWILGIETKEMQDWEEEGGE